MDIFYLLPLRLRPLAQGHIAHELVSSWDTFPLRYMIMIVLNRSQTVIQRIEGNQRTK